MDFHWWQRWNLSPVGFSAAGGSHRLQVVASGGIALAGKLGSDKLVVVVSCGFKGVCVMLRQQRRRGQTGPSTAELDESAQELLEANKKERLIMEQEIQELRERSVRLCCHAFGWSQTFLLLWGGSLCLSSPPLHYLRLISVLFPLPKLFCFLCPIKPHVIDLVPCL